MRQMMCGFMLSSLDEAGVGRLNGRAGLRGPDANAQQRDSVYGSFSGRLPLAQETNSARNHFISAA
jgi:hypothetical protein